MLVHLLTVLLHFVATFRPVLTAMGVTFVELACKAMLVVLVSCQVGVSAERLTAGIDVTSEAWFLRAIGRDTLAGRDADLLTPAVIMCGDILRQKAGTGGCGFVTVEGMPCPLCRLTFRHVRLWWCE